MPSPPDMPGYRGPRNAMEAVGPSRPPATGFEKTPLHRRATQSSPGHKTRDLGGTAKPARTPTQRPAQPIPHTGRLPHKPIPPFSRSYGEQATSNPTLSLFPPCPNECRKSVPTCTDWHLLPLTGAGGPGRTPGEHHGAPQTADNFAAASTTRPSKTILATKPLANDPLHVSSRQPPVLTFAPSAASTGGHPAIFALHRPPELRPRPLPAYVRPRQRVGQSTTGAQTLPGHRPQSRRRGLQALNTPGCTQTHQSPEGPPGSGNASGLPYKTNGQAWNLRRSATQFETG